MQAVVMFGIEVQKHGIKTQLEALFPVEPRSHGVIHWITVTCGASLVV